MLLHKSACMSPCATWHAVQYSGPAYDMSAVFVVFNSIVWVFQSWTSLNEQ